MFDDELFLLLKNHIQNVENGLKYCVVDEEVREDIEFSIRRAFTLVDVAKARMVNLRGGN